MKFAQQREKGVTRVRLAASAQPPRATSSSTPRPFSSQSPQSIPPCFALRTIGTRQEGLGCSGLPPAPPQEWDVLNLERFVETS
jgi:hypothetical protein